jgi:phage shock protein A
MNYENIEPAIAEIKSLIEPLKKSLNDLEASISQASAELSVAPKLSNMEKYAKDMIELLKKTPDEKKAAVAAEGFQKISEYCKVEQKLMSENVVKLKERQATLKSVIEHFDKHITSLEARKQAVERVANDDVDPRHPEKISTVREAEKLKKKNSDQKQN